MIPAAIDTKKGLKGSFCWIFRRKSFILPDYSTLSAFVFPAVFRMGKLLRELLESRGLDGGEDSSLEIFGAKIYLLFQYFCNQRVVY